MKILVIFTGGTIGSTVTDGFISPDRENDYKLMQMYRAAYKEKTDGDEAITFEYLKPFHTLSENMTCETVLKLLHCVDEQIHKEYDGIIVCHGTDTLQYSGVALSYALGLDCIPVVLVSSNYVLDDPRAKGVKNFAAAVELIKLHEHRGVFIAYQNDGKGVSIHRGSRVLPHPPYSDGVSSLFNESYGWFQGDIFDAPVFMKNPDYAECADEIECLLPMEQDGITDWSSNILEIYPAIGLSYPELVSCGKQYKAILHHTYHSGTICSVTPDLARFAKEAEVLGSEFYLTGANTETDYESAKIFGELGIRILPEASPIAMYMKLWLCYLCGKNPEKVMYQALGGDIK